MSPFNTDDKTFRIMRLTFIALFVFSFSLLASVHSQTMRVNINANNESTHSILEQIEQQTHSIHTPFLILSLPQSNFFTPSFPLRIVVPLFCYVVDFQQQKSLKINST